MLRIKTIQNKKIVKYDSITIVTYNPFTLLSQYRGVPMAIELSSLVFTEQNDIVPVSGVEAINNTGTANTLGGNDLIFGTKETKIDIPFQETYSGIFNSGTLNTADGDDIITGGTISEIKSSGNYYGIYNIGSIYTGDGNDSLLGDGNDGGFFNGFPNDINNSPSIINTGNGDDLISAFAPRGDGLRNYSIINTGDGKDLIETTGYYHGLLNEGSIDTGGDDDLILGTSREGDFYEPAIYNSGSINTSDGNDRITGRGAYNAINPNGVINSGIINTGNGEDSITSEGKFTNIGGVLLGDGNDSIAADTEFSNRALENFGFIGTGDGNDIINSTGIIYNQGVIETGNGDDSIIVNGGVEDNGTRYGIYNNGGAINMGDGNDSIIANEGFESDTNSSGAWFLGKGDDYIKGYGSGHFYGGNGNDTLELTPGTYTIGIWGQGGESLIFTKGNQLMITSEFEKLKAGSTIYDFTSLTAGQIIVVA